MLLFSFATAVFIAAYTLVDALGARLSHHSNAFLAWEAFSQSLIFTLIVISIKGKQPCMRYAAQHWQRGLISGILSLSAYAIILWAMTQAPIPYVSALRETSILFASFIAIVFLSEPFSISRMIATLLIVIGVVIVKH